MSLSIALLGPLHVTLAGEPVSFRTDAQRVLLAYLAAHQGVPVRRDALAGLLSPDRNDKDARTYLRNRLTRLRSALRDEAASSPWFLVDRKQIALRRGEDVVVDVVRFRELVREVETHAHRRLAGCPACLVRLQEAVALVRGEFLAGLHFPSDVWESWLLAQREHYTQRALEAMTWLRDAYREQGAWEAVLDAAQGQLALEPWLETAHRAIMQAHFHLGDRNAALAQYERCAAILWEELGVEPEEETRRLQQQILDGGLSTPAAPASRGNLPSPATPFFGREAEQARLLHLLVDPTHRLITLVGPGGIGKTRLALEVGAQVAQSFADGVWFVSLDGVTGREEQVQAIIGEALGLGQGERQLTGPQVLARLRDKQMLLILDNCETMLDALAFIPGWLRRAPGLAILATSRTPLNFQAESVVWLAGLPQGQEETPGPAEEMFAALAQMARDAFALSPENLAQVRRICALVEGLPLGITLAAAWTRRRSLAQITDALGRSLDVLSTNLRDVPPRHRSIRAAFETSWAMLGSEQQQVLAALSVFPGAFSPEAAARVAGASLFHLDALCEHSLLQQDQEAERYVMHSLVRQFAAEKLAGRTPTVEQAFVAHFRAFARAHRDDYARLQPEWTNLAAAVARAHAQRDWPAVLDLVHTLDEPWFRQMRLQDMRDGLILALDAAAGLGDEPGLMQTLLRLGEIQVELNDYAGAETRLEEALARAVVLEEGLGIAQAQMLLGRIRREQGQDEEALTLLEEARRIFEAENHLPGLARALNLLALCHMGAQGRPEVAADYLGRSIELQKALPPSSTLAEALRHLARLRARAGAHVEAENLLIQAARVSREVQDRGEEAAVLFEQMVLCKRRGQWAAALGFGQACLAHFQELGSLRWQGLVKTQMGLLHQAQGEWEQAVSLLQEARQIFVEVGDPFEETYTLYYLHRLYEEMGRHEESLAAKVQAQRLNRTLNIPFLRAQLAS